MPLSRNRCCLHHHLLIIFFLFIFFLFPCTSAFYIVQLERIPSDELLEDILSNREKRAMVAAPDELAETDDEWQMAPEETNFLEDRLRQLIKREAQRAEDRQDQEELAQRWDALRRSIQARIAEVDDEDDQEEEQRQREAADLVTSLMLNNGGEMARRLPYEVDDEGNDEEVPIVLLEM